MSGLAKTLKASAMLICALTPELCPMRPIRWVIDPIVNRNVGDSKWIDALKATDVIAVLLGVRAPLVVSMDAAHGAKVVLGRTGVELIDLEMLCASGDA
jgi:hypothetical protein